MHDSPRHLERDHDHQPQPDIQAELLTAEQVAALCGIATRTWRRMTSSGQAPAPIRLGNRLVRWPRQQLLDWIADGCPRQAKGGAR